MSAQFAHSIDEELIAAYVDGDVTAEQRLRVETAMAADQQVAWEVESLRRTVELLHDMPRVALPRSFVLAESQVEEVLHARRARSNPAPPAGIEAAPADAPWQRFLSYLAGGNPLYRNAAMAATVLLLIAFAAEIPLRQDQAGSLSTAGGQPAAQTATPRIRVTSVGGAASGSAASGTAVPEEHRGGGIGVMSAGESPSDAENAESSPGAGPQTGDQTGAGESRAAGQPAQPPSVSTPPATFEPPETVNNWYSPPSLLRSARIVLVPAIILFWLLSRRRPRNSSA